MFYITDETPENTVRAFVYKALTEINEHMTGIDHYVFRDQDRSIAMDVYQMIVNDVDGGLNNDFPIPMQLVADVTKQWIADGDHVCTCEDCK